MQGVYLHKLWGRTDALDDMSGERDSASKNAGMHWEWYAARRKDEQRHRLLQKCRGRVPIRRRLVRLFCVRL